MTLKGWWWNHPGWGVDSILWHDVHETLYQKGWLNGIEVFNEFEWYPVALNWVNEKNLTLLCNTDVHDVIERLYDFRTTSHRPMTLVLSKDRTEEGIREALFDRRTLIWFYDTLMGKEDLLQKFFAGTGRRPYCFYRKPINTIPMKSVLFKHRSIRKFRSTPIPEDVLHEILEAASRASTCGNMQLYSLVVTRDAALRGRLAPCHFNQPMVTQAPCVVTVCADVHRFSMWCRQRDADPAYDNFAWFLNAATDALLAAQNLCVEAELKGLGICYLGTTIYTAGEIADILELPKGVIPLTTVVVGYPDESPELTDRLQLEGVVHYEKYTDYTAAEIDELWAEREESELTKRLLEENGLPNLAQVFTQRRYVRKDNLAISNSYFALLKEKGFFNN